jgi:hypothetical protein
MDSEALDAGMSDTSTSDANPVDASTCADVCSDSVCAGELCCSEPELSGGFSLPAHVTWTHWEFSPARTTELVADVRILHDPGSEVGLYFSPMSAVEIDGTQFYLGLQTDINMPGQGAVGKGFIFSQFGTLERSAIRVAPGGFFEQGTHEGNFIGVRLPFEWTAGSYKLRLHWQESEGAADWFALSVTDAASNLEHFAGALRFDRADPATRATIGTRVTSFTEIYAGATDYAEVPLWSLAYSLRARDAALDLVRSDYPSFPIAEFPNADQWFDIPNERVRVDFGARTPRCHAAGRLR